MSDLVIQVLVRKLSNIKRRHILAELKHRFWRYSVIQSFSVTNPGLKNDVFVRLFPLCTLLHNRGLTIVSLVGNTTRRAER